MKEVAIDQVLAQMRALAGEASGALPSSTSPPATGEEFATLFAQSIERGNALQHEAARVAEAFELGQSGVDIAEVMIAGQKASIAFEAMVQVRNRLLSAYQDIMNMPI